MQQFLMCEEELKLKLQEQQENSKDGPSDELRAYIAQEPGDQLKITVCQLKDIFSQLVTHIQQNQGQMAQ